MRVLGKKCLALVLALALCLSLVPGMALAATEETPQGTTYALVTDVTTLAAGDQIIIAAAGYDRALGAASDNGNFRNEVTIEKNTTDNTITLPADSTVSVITLTTVTTEGAFGLQVENNQYLNAAYLVSGKYKNNLQVADDATATTAHFKFTMDDSSVTHITSEGAVKDGTHYEIQYNSTTNQTRFSCYTGSQKAVAVYKLSTGGSDTPTTAQPTATVNGAALASGGNLVKGDAAPTVTLTAADGAAIYYTTDGTTTPSYDTTTSTATGTEYTAPITLAGGANTIKAIAVKDGVASTVKTLNYTVLTKTTPGAAHDGTNGTVYAVEGLLTVQSGNSIYLETADGGAVCVYLKERPANLTPGTTILAMGTHEVNKNQPRLKDGVFTVTNATPTELPCTTATLAEVLAADHTPDLLSRRVKISGLTLGTKSGNNTPVSADDTSINIYQCPALPTDVHPFKPGTTVNVTAVVGCYNARQLLVGAASDVEWVADPAAAQDPTSAPASGGTVAPGGTVSFTSDEGATFTYKVGDNTTTDWTTVTEQTGDTYTVPAGAAEDSTIVIKVTAHKEGLDDSSEVTITLTVKESLVGKLAKKTTEALADGAKFIIHHVTSGTVMTTVATGKKLQGEAATVDEDYIPITADMAVLTAHLNSDGQYTFTNEAGLYLTSGATGNSLTFAEAPAADATDYTLWTVTGDAGARKVVSVNAQYNGTPQALEYYNGFTTFSDKDTDAYRFDFYTVTNDVLAPKVAAPTIDPPSGSGTDASKQVTITCATEGASIYYTTDGAEPTTASTAYTAPFTLTLKDGANVVKAIAVKADMRNSDVASVTYTKVDPDADFVLVTTCEEVLAGGYFVLVPKEFPNVAMGATFPNPPAEGTDPIYYRPTPVAVTMANDSYAPVIKFASQDDGVSLQSVISGSYLGYSGSGTSFAPSATPYKYTVSGPNSDGAFRIITSTGSSRPITYQSNNNNQFGPYAASNDGKTTESTDKTVTYGPYECDMLVYRSVNGFLYNPSITLGTMNDARVGEDWTVSFSFSETDVVSNVKGWYRTDGEAEDTWHEAAVDTAANTLTVPANAITAAGKLIVKVTATDTRDTTVKTIEVTGEIAIVDEPAIGSVAPANGVQTGADKRPVIRVTVKNGGADFTAALTLTPAAGEAITANMTVEDGAASYTPAADLADGRWEAQVTVTRADKKTVSKTWSFTVGEAHYTKYFGQLHSHTGEYSDGAGTLQSALDYVKALPESANVDFVAFTDHSNYFDSKTAANPEDALYDTSLMTADSAAKWTAYTAAAAAFNSENAGKLVALSGFEMTWSGGPGHINTWNTPGIVSRNNETLNNKTSDAGMKAYYALLDNEKGVETISQFNHPGSTFGTFTDFSYWDALTDSRMYLVEVGNGEGQIGAGGYFPSYEYYTMALDKGWHLAPTNNQDNHKGKWGNANEARDVILAEDLSQAALYDAIRAYRVYATEDKNLEIDYTLNDHMMGAIIPEEEAPEKIAIQVKVHDPDASDSISKVEVIVNSGKVAHTWNDPAQLATGELTCELDPDYSYYYIRVTQGDGDLAVTAPVWVGTPLQLGVSNVECGTSMPVTGEELTLTTSLFNGGSTPATVKSVTYTTNGSEVLATDTPERTIPANGTLTVDWAYTPNAAKIMSITVTVVLEQDGQQYTFTKSLELDVTDSSAVSYIGIDASHYNEYVAGNYKDSMGNFANLAVPYGLRTVYLDTSEKLIAAAQNADGKYKMLILTAPSRRLAAAQADPRTYSQAELEAIAAFNAKGGTVVLAGWSDNYENFDFMKADKSIKHMAATQNEVLAALGSSLRISDDATYDDVRSAADGVDKWRLYFNTYGESFLTDRVEVDPEHPYDRLYTEVFSHYGGASIYAVDAQGTATSTLPAAVTPVVYGHASTYSVDVDTDGLGGDSIPKYTYAEGDDRLMVMATEQLDGKGLIVVAGAAFLSNFEVQATISDSNAEKNYANYKICENLCQYVNPLVITPIADVQAEPDEGVKFNIEGVVTSNASGYDKDTAFFDCIYVQDATGGINAFPVAGNYKIGDKVRITGTTSSYNGERQIAVKSITLLSEGNEVAPKAVTAAQINDGSVLGQLITLKGTVESFEKAEGLVQTIMVKDAQGNTARVFIDGYITKLSEVRNLRVGAEITVTGLASYDDTFNAPDGPFPRIRIRDRADVVIAAPSSPAIPAKPSTPDDKPVTETVTAPDGTVTETVTSPDGTVTETVTTPEGAVTETVTNPDGSVAVTVTDPEGVVKAQVNLPAPSEEQGDYFTDIPRDHWSKPAAEELHDLGLVNGTQEHIFTGAEEMDRGMMAAILHRLSGSIALGENVFADVPATAYYAPAVAWAVPAGVIQGVDATHYEPTRSISRQELALMLYRYAQLLGVDTTAQSGASAAFSDADDLSAWAVEAMDWAVSAGLIKGVGGNLLAPTDTATREQAVTVVSRFLSLLK